MFFLYENILSDPLPVNWVLKFFELSLWEICSERLPKNAISYIKAIEKSVGCPAFIISTSPDRDDIIEVQNPFER